MPEKGSGETELRCFCDDCNFCPLETISDSSVTSVQLGGTISVASDDTQIQKLMSRLPAEDQDNLRSLFFDPIRRTLAQVADEKGVTRQTVARRRDAALEILRLQLGATHD